MGYALKLMMWKFILKISLHEEYLAELNKCTVMYILYMSRNRDIPKLKLKACDSM